MPCQGIVSKLLEYQEGLLEPKEAGAVERHLAACPACQAEAARHEATWELVGADPLVEAPPDLARRVLAEARRTAEAEPAEVIRPARWHRWLVPALAAAAVAAVVAGALLLQRPSKEGPLLAGLTEEEQQVVSNLELLEDYDLLKNLDLLENLELLEHQEAVQNL